MRWGMQILTFSSTEAHKDKPAKLLKPKPKPQNPKTQNTKPNHLVRLMACDSDSDYFTEKFNAFRI